MRKIIVFLILTIIISACATEAPAPTVTSEHTATSEPSATPQPSATLEPTTLPIYDSSTSYRYINPGDYIHEITVDGVQRMFVVHIPPGYIPGESMPLVINFHGRSSTAFEQEETSQMNSKADEEGFIVVAPQALDDPATWWGSVPREIGDQDRKFMGAMIASLRREISIDPARIYATGMSNGGSMSNGMGCALSDMIVGIAPVSGGHVFYEECYPEHPVSVFAIHGTDDHIIPYEGDYSYGDERDTIAVHVWIEAWAERNGCDIEPVFEEPYPTITLETWGNCDEGVEVTLLTIEGGEHTWPTTRYGTDWGEIQLYIDATNAVWEFFETHPRQ